MLTSNLRSLTKAFNINDLRRIGWKSCLDESFLAIGINDWKLSVVKYCNSLERCCRFVDSAELSAAKWSAKAVEGSRKREDVHRWNVEARTVGRQSGSPDRRMLQIVLHEFYSHKIRNSLKSSLNTKTLQVFANIKITFWIDKFCCRFCYLGRVHHKHLYL